MHEHERLSALVDDAGDASDLQFLADAADRPGVRDTWARYHLIGDILRERESRTFDSAFINRVAAVIAREPVTNNNVVQMPARPARKPLTQKPAARIVLAASVAALALGGFFTLNETPNTVPSVAASKPLNALTVAGRPEIPVLKEGEYQRRLNAYLVNFNEQRAQLRAPGVHPHVRIVDFETGAP